MELLREQQAAAVARTMKPEHMMRRWEGPLTPEPEPQPLLARETDKVDELARGQSFGELDAKARALDDKVRALREARLVAGVRTADSYTPTRAERDAESLLKRVTAARDSITKKRIAEAFASGALKPG